MDGKIKKFMEGSIWPFSSQGSEEAINIYSIDKMAIFAPEMGIDFDVGFHHHKNYELFFNLDSNFVMNVEKTRVMVGPNEFLPINPRQVHGAAESTKGSRVMAIFIDNNFLQGLSHTVFKDKEIMFKSHSIRPSVAMNNLIQSFINEATNRQTGYQFFMESIAGQFVVLLLRKAKKTSVSVVSTMRRSGEKHNINSVIEYLNECYNKDFCMEDIAKIANLSPYHFIRVFKAETGKTPYEYLIGIKIEKAKKLLEVKERSITEICFLCGFSNLSHFSAVFKKKVGLSPMEFRKTILGI